MPLIPRIQFHEIDDQPWFPPFLRTYVQGSLTEVWTTRIPLLQPASPAHVAANTLTGVLGLRTSAYAFVDFCAGAGGPTPAIERHVNRALRAAARAPVRFVMTDLHPNPWGWEAAVKRAAARGDEGPVCLGYEPGSVDASAAPRGLVEQYTRNGGKVFRLYNLAFHHFDNELARRILKNTVETSHGFAIFELQDRTLSTVFSLFMLAIGIFLAAPYYAWKWRAPSVLFFTYVLPVLPFVLVFDGVVSALRTRSPDEVEALLRSCGAEGAEKWTVVSGRVQVIWPWGNLNYVIGMPAEG
ncbi:hypothetical protein TD95_001744 [Thielaviopsis punctulata]|uniref:Methyltransferase domain-containing protein n=1 Tax=Thielaviopsis punctulata TaxID=72032 RepID=A0A0F4ZAT9_9PEZI|nr:hypothetical protein TD95_001744 [Thielaviopsis punctulata]